MRASRRRSAHGGNRRRWWRNDVPLYLGVLATAGLAIFLSVECRLHWLVAYLAAVNAATFSLYGYDKAAARADLLRVPEKSLHLFGLAGGTPGAFVARHLFRHKTVKTSFRVTFWLLAVAQAGILAWALWRF